MNQLKPKLTLAGKGEQASIVVTKLKVVLEWSAPVDLDLMAFYRAKDGRTGGVFSDGYPGGNRGSLKTFPFIKLSADSGIDQKSEYHQEELIVERFDDMSELYICALNYTDAAEQRNSAFANYGGQVTATDNKGHSIVVPLNATQEGHVAVIVKILQDSDGEAVLKNENLILSLGQFFESIPGAVLLSSGGNRQNPSPPNTHSSTQSTTTSEASQTQAMSRWVESVRLRAYDNPVIDKSAEKDLLRDLITQGFTVETAHQKLLQVCEKERYALISHLEWQAMQILEQCLAKKQGIDQDCFNNAVNVVVEAAHQHLKKPDCRILIKELILAKQLAVKQGFLKGGQWFKDI
jgi:uncharacterized protein involved in tellurium resistance